jgi:hypothetical protein
VHLATYLGLLQTGSRTLADSYRQVAHGHAEEADVFHLCLQLADACEEHEEALKPITDRYGSHPAGEPERLHADGLSETRSGGLGLVRDLHDLYLLAGYLDMAWTVVGQAGKGAHDEELIEVVGRCSHDISVQLSWLTTRLKAAAPQALLVAD